MSDIRSQAPLRLPAASRQACRKHISIRVRPWSGGDAPTWPQFSASWQQARPPCSSRACRQTSVQGNSTANPDGGCWAACLSMGAAACLRLGTTAALQCMGPTTARPPSTCAATLVNRIPGPGLASVFPTDCSPANELSKSAAGRLTCLHRWRRRRRPAAPPPQ